MADSSSSLVDLIKSVAGGPKPALNKPFSLLSTNPDAPGQPLTATSVDGLKVYASSYFPAIPAEALAGFATTDPSRPQGALEVLSVKQIRGPTEGGLAPVQVRTFPVRGNIV